MQIRTFTVETSKLISVITLNAQFFGRAQAAVRSKAVVLLLVTVCLLLLPLLESVIVLCFVVRYCMSSLVWCCALKNQRKRISN